MHGVIAQPPRPDEQTGLRRRRPLRPLLVLGLIALSLLLTAHVMIGTTPMGVGQVVKALLGMAGDPVDRLIVWGFRLPRALVVVVAGAMLGLSGAILQSLTRNPLAEPGLIGVTAGAVLAIVSVVVAASKLEGLGMVDDSGPWLALIGVAGGLGAGALTFALSWRRGLDPTLLVLTGVLVSGMLGAFAALVLLNADENQVQLVLHWTIGSSNGRVWTHWRMLWPFALTGIAAALASAGLANMLQLGDGVATGLGLRVEAARFWLLFLSAWLTAGAVAVVGGIGFVGLIGPHLARQLVGGDARRLFPAAAIVSGLLLTAADLAARTLPLGWLADITGLPIAGRAGLPVGAITPLLGVPFFLWLLLRPRKGDTT